MSQGKKRLTAHMDEIRALARLLEETGLSELEYRDDAVHVRLSKLRATGPALAGAPHAAYGGEEGAARVGSPGATSASARDEIANHPGLVKSPMVGVVYLSPEPNAPPFVGVGDPVGIGDSLLLIEAMKVFNPIKSPVAGKVARILVSHGMPVEFGEPLMVIE